MVKVLANGDIVPDDDPRASGRSNVSSSAERNRPRQVKSARFAPLQLHCITVFSGRDARIYIRGQIFCGYPQFPTDTDRIRISDFKTHTDTDRIWISI